MSLPSAPPRWSRPATRQLWQVPLFFLGLAALVGVSVARPTWHQGDARQLERDLARARQVLEQRRSASGELVPLADHLLAHANGHPDRKGEICFLAGSIYVSIAEHDPAATVLDAWHKARAYLEEAQILGVAETDILRLTYLLAKALYHTGGDVQEIIEFLERSIDEGADQPAEGYALLADAYLHLPTRNVEAALHAIEKALAVPFVPEDLLGPARLLRGELLLELRRTDDARAALANVGTQAPPAVLAKARYLRALSLQEAERWADAEARWKEALEDRAVPPREPAKMLYYLGVCYRKLEQPTEAARVWAACAARGDAGDAGAAAAVCLAEVQLGEADPTPALETLGHAVRDIKGPADWHNAFVDLNRVREVFESGCNKFRQLGRFEPALRLAALYEPLAPEGTAQLQLGRAAFEWGRQATGEDARALFRQAGEAFVKASELASVPAERIDRLWQAVESFAAAREPARTISSVETLIKSAGELAVPLEPRRHGEALFLRAEAHRSLGEETLALYDYGECINYRSPFAYRARYQQAQAEARKNRIDEARSILEQNLHLLHEEENPDREAQEKTLYALAHLLYNSHDYSGAATYYKQALDKYRDNPDSLVALQQLADCHVRLADAEAKAGAQERISPVAQAHHQKESRRYVQQAAGEYQELAEFLTKRSAARSLTPDEESLYWQSHLNSGICEYKLSNYTVAKGLFEQLALRYEGRAQELYARCYLASCCYTLGGAENTELAKQNVARIRAQLAKLSDQDLEIGPDSMDRKKWETWLDQVSKPVGDK